jgi:hypothetical protein
VPVGVSTAIAAGGALVHGRVPVPHRRVLLGEGEVHAAIRRQPPAGHPRREVPDPIKRDRHPVPGPQPQRREVGGEGHLALAPDPLELGLHQALHGRDRGSQRVLEIAVDLLTTVLGDVIVREQRRCIGGLPVLRRVRLAVEFADGEVAAPDVAAKLAAALDKLGVGGG